MLLLLDTSWARGRRRRPARLRRGGSRELWSRADVGCDANAP